MLKAHQVDYENTNETVMRGIANFLVDTRPKGVYLISATYTADTQTASFSLSGDNPDTWVDDAVTFAANTYGLKPTVYTEVNLVKSFCKTPMYYEAVKTGSIDPVAEVAKPDVDLLTAEEAQGTFVNIVNWFMGLFR